MPQRSAQDMVSYALEMDPALLPYASELLADLDALGSDVSSILGAIAELGLGAATVVDLGSGKGAVAIALAGDMGLTVHGIELFEPFVEVARQAAAKAGVSDRCRFSHGDIAAMASTTAPVDVAVYAALGDVLGPLDVTVGIIRRYVRPGGFLVINDSCLRDGVTESFPGFEHCGTLEQTRTLLQAHGDELVAELLEAEDDGDDEDHAGGGDAAGIDEAAVIRARAEALAQRHPELGAQLRAFAASQLAEYEYLERHTTGVVWVLRRRT
ncbi:MAG: methyltransferase domain-containing protein [Acidimicrobiales bacterium]